VSDLDPGTPDRDDSRLPPLYGSGKTTPGVGAMGMSILIVSLSVLFVASMVGYLVVRGRNPEWSAPGTPGLPPGLWASTMVLLFSSVTMHGALRSVRLGRGPAFRTFMLLTTLLGFAFLVSQALAWMALAQRHLTAGRNLYAFTFYMLTGLHGAHVIGGLIPLCVVTTHAFHGRYSREHHPGVQYVSMYWHFLDIVWLVLFTLLVVVG
jgi:cytochrome c oxidase subunit 3